MTRIKFIRIAKEDEEYSLILKHINQEQKLPYIFQVGDIMEITDGGNIETDRRTANLKLPKDIPSLEWLTRRLAELHYKIDVTLQNNSFISQADVYERNYLIEIINELHKKNITHD